MKNATTITPHLSKEDSARILGISGEMNPAKVRAACQAKIVKYRQKKTPQNSPVYQILRESYDALKDCDHSIDVSIEENYLERVDHVLRMITGLGFKIELIGSWVWITGDTKPYRETLKKLSFRWAKDKGAWYIHPKGWTRHASRELTLDSIRSTWGSVLINEREQEPVLA